MRDEYDFSKAKGSGDIPHLARLRSEANGKTRITIMLDNDVLASFRKWADVEGLGYQTLINQTLRANIGSNTGSRPLDEQTLRRVIREEMSAGT